MKKLILFAILMGVSYAQSSDLLLLYSGGYNNVETKLYLAGQTVSGAQATRIDDFITMLKDSLSITSLSSKFDIMYLLANQNSTLALRNLVKRSNDATLAGTPNPTFTAYEGFQGDGAHGYINTNYTISSQAANFTQNSASFGAYSRTADGNNGCFVGTSSTAVYRNDLMITSDATILGRINADAGTALAITGESGMFVASRTASNVTTVYRNSSSLGTNVNPSRAITTFTSPAAIAARNNNGTIDQFSTHQLAFAFIGAGLTATEVRQITNCIEWYMDSLGKGLIASTPVLNLTPGVDKISIQVAETSDSVRIYKGTSANPTIWSFSIAPVTTYADSSLSPITYYYRGKNKKDGYLSDYSSNYSTTVFQNTNVDSFPGAWTWFNDPRGFFYNNNIYVGAISKTGNLLGYQINTSTGVTSRYDYGLIELDDHSNPTFLMRSDKKLLMFYTKHLDTKYRMRVSTNPEDISSFGAEQDLAFGLDEYTYSNAIQIADTIFNFIRATDGIRTMIMTKSTDDGVTWSYTKLLNTYRPYFKVIKNGDRIDILCNDNHPTDNDSNSTYHFYYEAGYFHKSDGTLLGSPPYTPSSSLTRIYNGKNEKSWVWDIKIDTSTNYPVAAFASFPSNTHHRYWYAKWNGSSWDVDTLVNDAGTYLYSDEPNYSGGICIDPDSTNIVYCSIETGGVHQLWRYVRNGGGWDTTQLTTTKAIRPYVISGAPPNKRILYLSGTYTSWTDYNTYIKFINGF